MKNPEGFLKAVNQGKVEVAYRNIYTGETRRMICTLCGELIPAKGCVRVKQQPDNAHFVVWALDRDAWRSFRTDTVLDWRIL